MDATTTDIPLSQRINVRMLIFAAVALLLIGYPIYIYFSESLTGGIHDYGSYKLVDLKAMSNFEMDQVNGTPDQIPAQWRELDGKRVALEGELWQPTGAGDKMTGFQLCYSIAKCCFSGPPKVQHFVDAHVVDGKSVEYHENLVRVVGTLHVNIKKDKEAGKILSIYQLDVDSLEPK
jgi:hypothetical protein